MNFWSGQVLLRHAKSEEKLEARVFLDIDFDLKIEVPDYLGVRALLLGTEEITCEIPGVDEPIELLLSHTTHSETNEQKLVFTPARSPIWKLSPAKAVRGRGALINFGGFKSKRHSRFPISLEACGWRVTMIPVDENLLSYPQLLQSDEHKITHQLEFERSDHAEFSDQQMLDFLENLSLFFSFCHGGWVAIALAVAMDEHGFAIAEEWGVGRVGPQNKPSGFLDQYHLDGLIELYPLFMQKLCDDGWAEVFSHAVYWP